MSISNRAQGIWSDTMLGPRLQVDALCREFERLWHGATRRTIESFLESIEDNSIRELLLPELVAAEWEFRLQSGETPVREEYRRRFPEITALLDQLELLDLRDIGHSESETRKSPIEFPSEFNGFRILRVLGRGAMGTVYLAELPIIGQQVALKVLGPHHRFTDTGAARFEREAKVLARLDHPGIVPLYSYGEANGVRYLVMKLVDGLSLTQALSVNEDSRHIATKQLFRKTGFTNRRELAFHIMCQLCDALQAVHRAGILHRDVKPSNILVTESSHVFLTDFSLARIESEDVSLTQHDEFVGTLRYSSPESLDGKYSRQGDIYSLGLIFFELLTGKTPFSATTRRDLLRQKLMPALPELASADIPVAIRRIIEKMTAYSPEARFQSVDDVAEALKASAFSTQTPVKKWTRPIVCGCVLIAALVGWKLLSSVGDGTSIPDTSAAANTRDSIPQSARKGAEIAHEVVSADPPVELPRWIESHQSYLLPDAQPARLISLSGNGCQLIAVDNRAQFFVLESDSEIVPESKEFQWAIRGISQSYEGDIIIVTVVEPGIPEGLSAASISEGPRSTVESWTRGRQKWRLAAGGPFHFSDSLPTIVPWRDDSNSTLVLLPSLESPLFWDAEVMGFAAVKWPEGNHVGLAACGAPGNMTVSVLDDGRMVLRRWAGAAGGSERWTLQQGIHRNRHVSISPDQRLILHQTTEQLEILSTTTGEVLGQFDIAAGVSMQYRFSVDCDWLVVAADALLLQINLKEMTLSDSKIRTTARILQAACYDNGAFILIAEQSGRIQMFEQSGSPCEGELNSGPLSSCSFSDDNLRLAVAQEDGLVNVFDIHMPK